MADHNDDIQGALESALKPYADSIDEDTFSYIASLLQDDPYDSDAREAVGSLIVGSLPDEQVDGEEVCRSLFALLDLGRYSTPCDNGESVHILENADGNDVLFTGNSVAAPRKLNQAVTMKAQDIQTYASGLRAESYNDDPKEEMKESQIASFYANMIDVGNAAAQSERVRRKQRQKEIREQMEQEERSRAIQQAMEMLQTTETNTVESMMEKSADNGADVHFTNLDLPNLRGGGPPLLQNANITFSRGRRYGLMGRNGCGKTTFLTFMASRQMEGAVPKHMNMVLVRQEIMGNEWTAVETVLKSDVKRESVKRFIAYCEEELEKLDQGNKNPTIEDADDRGTNEESKGRNNESKGRQKLRERKRQNLQKSARKAAESSTTAQMQESKDAQRLKLNEKLGLAYQRLAQVEEEEGGDPEPRARKVLAGLGFAKEMQDKPTDELSGGWRMRVSISCALFANPSLLLLDEPTNHLDLESVLWLERYLTTTFSGTLVVVSHDRHFLNEVVTDVVHFHRSQLTTYRGDISSFEAVRDDDRLRQQRQREQQEAKRAHLQKYIDLHAQAGENGVKAARQRKSKMKKLDKLGVMAQDGKKWKASYDGDAEEVEEVLDDEEVILNFPDPGAFDGDIVRLEQVKFGYSAQNILLETVDLTVNLKSRIALLGRNGCGKSTLIKLAVGALQSMQGKVVIDPGAKIEYLAQHQLEQLDPDGTPLQTMVDRYPGDHSNTHIGELRRYLANFGLGGEILPVQKIHTMSGGQKCRVCLACAMYRKPHLLILDEPTNHLDLETTAALIDAIKTFQGGVLLVSHDQHLLTSVCEDLLVVENGRVEVLRDGNSNADAFNAYKKAVVAGRR
jgi:ATP-binding cassette subfamily F protein 3